LAYSSVLKMATTCSLKYQMAFRLHDVTFQKTEPFNRKSVTSRDQIWFVELQISWMVHDANIWLGIKMLFSRGKIPQVLKLLRYFQIMQC
jgi:hypothetical protein